jgi:hypothetical protein
MFDQFKSTDRHPRVEGTDGTEKTDFLFHISDVINVKKSFSKVKIRGIILIWLIQVKE